MQDLMVNALKGHNADYVELRLETLDGNRISYRGRDLEDISSSLNFGGGHTRGTPNESSDSVLCFKK